jgi:uncharacterized protein YhdP
MHYAVLPQRTISTCVSHSCTQQLMHTQTKNTWRKADFRTCTSTKLSSNSVPMHSWIVHIMQIRSNVQHSHCQCPASLALLSHQARSRHNQTPWGVEASPSPTAPWPYSSCTAEVDQQAAVGHEHNSKAQIRATSHDLVPAQCLNSTSASNNVNPFCDPSGNTICSLRILRR